MSDGPTDSAPARDPGDGHSPFDAISPYIHPGPPERSAELCLLSGRSGAGLRRGADYRRLRAGPINRPNATEIWAKHYTYQVRSAGIGLLYTIVSGILVLAFGLGFVLLLLTAVWWIVRAIRGLMAASRGEAVQDPLTWTW